MYDLEKVKSSLLKAVSTVSGIDDDEIDMDSPSDEYNLDSLDWVEVIMLIENDLDVEVVDEVMTSDPSKSLNEIAEDIDNAIH